MDDRETVVTVSRRRYMELAAKASLVDLLEDYVMDRDYISKEEIAIILGQSSLKGMK